MFREMRQKERELSFEESAEVLARGSSGVLALHGDGGYPYAVPLSYVYRGGTLYFHGAKSGHKNDAIERDERASFCVTDKDEVVQEQFTSLFRSVVAFGRARILDSEEEKRAALELFAEKYSPDVEKARREGAIEGGLPFVCVFALEIEHMSGKEGRPAPG